MSDISFTLFDTAIGACAIAWGPRGVAAIQLPGSSRASTGAGLRRRCPGAREAAPPPAIERAIAAITALLRGEAVDLGFVELDLARVGEFERRVYALARAVPPGGTVTYGELASKLGDPLLARDVGQAMGANPFPLVVPCHRVLAAGGKPGGFSAPGGVVTKLRLLRIEGSPAGGQPTLFDL
jgi:methylated-DNA-[protein]-cysteine S-methyltransferase